MKAFLSSTFKDLEQHRAAVIARLRRLDGMQVRCMEDFGARADSPKELCVRESRECDLFIGIIGHLYGFIPEGDDTSITEQEYRAAEDAGRDMLLFVAPSDFAVPVDLLLGDTDLHKQRAFRTRVLSRTVVDLDWSSPETLASGVVEAVHNWRLRQTGSGTALPAVPGIDLITYAKRCRKRWEAVDLSALAAPGALDGDVELPKLSQVFIPQACRRSRPAVSLPRDYLERQGLDPDEEERLLEELQERWMRQERLPALELLARPDASKLVLLGDPGAGKSSLTRFVLLQLLDPLAQSGSGGDWRRTLDGTWPVLVELRDLLAREAEGRCSDLVGYLAFGGETQGFGFDRAAVEAQLRDRPSLIIVDGLDEIFSLQRRRAMVEEIVGLESRFPRARVLVTSRIAGFDAKAFEAAGFTLATLDDLDEDQVNLFSETWFNLAFPGEPEKAARARGDLLEALERRPQLAVLAGNPLILTIMAIIARHKRLARSRTQLYAQALEVLCYAWDYRRGLALPSDSPLVDLQPEDTLLILRRIAWRMQESTDGLRANAISEAELRTILNDFFEIEWRFSPPRARRAAAEMMKLLQERNWILTTRGPELYGFVHRTFLEYLCALELTKRFEAQEITLETLRDEHVLPRVVDDSYAEVIRLLCGQLPVRAADQLIVAITPTEEKEIAEGKRLLLAWQSLGELDPRALATAASACDAALGGLYRWISQGFVETTIDILGGIIEAVNMIEPGSWSLASVNEFAFPFSDAGGAIFDFVNRALAKAIWLPEEEVRNKLFLLLESPNSVERQRSVGALDGEIPDGYRVFPILRRLIETDEDSGVRDAAIQALTRSLTAQPETFEILRRCANEDSNPAVRRTAVRALAGSFAERDDTYEIMRKRIEEDESEEVRFAAIQVLARSFADRSELFDLLRRWVEEDEGEMVRSTAVRALAQSFADRSETFELLRKWGGESDSERVRAAAAHALGRFAERDEAFELLRKWAGESDSESVRAAAVEALGNSFGKRDETFELLRNWASESAGESVRAAAVESLAESFAERPETFELMCERADNDSSEIVRTAAVAALGGSFAKRAKTLEISKGLARSDISENVRRGAILAWAQSLDSRFLRRLLTRDLDAAAPGIDPHVVIRPAWVEEAAAQLREHPTAVREAYEHLVGEHGFPLRLSWLEDGGEGDPPSHSG